MDDPNNVLVQWLNNQHVQRLMIIAIGFFVVLVVNFFVQRAFKKTITNNAHKYRARKAVNLLAYTLLVIVVLFVYSDRLGNIGVALGVAGAGIAFALQEIIVSLAGWLNIMISGSLSVGHRIKVGEVKGDIIDIGILTTTIMEIGDWVKGDLYNGRIITLSNSFIFKEKVHNYSGEYPFLWDEIQFPIRTGTDHRLAREIFTNVLNEVCGDYAQRSQAKWKQLANKYRVEEAQVSPMVTIEVDENWIVFTMRYIVDYKRRRTTKDIIYSRILEEIEKTDGKVQIATSTIEVTTVS